MRCPFCNHNRDKVLDSREKGDGLVVRRRRECLACQRRFTTYERIEEIPYMVVKRDERREPFDRGKILAGMRKACEKRPISITKLEQIGEEIERELTDRVGKEIPSVEIGEKVINKLFELDEIAYVRFASVYRQFKDINQFMSELKDLLAQKSRV